MPLAWAQAQGREDKGMPLAQKRVGGIKSGPLSLTARQRGAFYPSFCPEHPVFIPMPLPFIFSPKISMILYKEKASQRHKQGF